jgi:Ca-activated chloride channel family protein
MIEGTMTMNDKIGLLAVCVALAGCGDDGAAAEGAEGVGGVGAGVGQGGAQDFGQFRAILDAGQIPGPDTLDDVGFFNEHKIELPPADCGQSVCLHGQLGVMGNLITTSNCTMVLLGLNTPIDPSTMQRPPLNLAIAVDTSGSMQGPSIAYVREGLLRMLDDLRPEDRVSLIGFDTDATAHAENVAGDAPELATAIQGLEASGNTNIYDGLRAAYEVVAEHADAERQNRVILLSDGAATAGITSEAVLVDMSRTYNELGYGLTTIGMGQEFSPELMRELSEAGAGAFYFLEDPAAVQEVFEEEVATFLVPLAEDLKLDIVVEGDYALRAVYGTKLFGLESNSAYIDMPTVQIAHRTSVEDHAAGRRGGGGAILVELVPSAGASTEAGGVGTLAMTYRVPGGEELVSQEVRIESPRPPGETPEEGAFDGFAVEKAFVMLNIYVGFDMAATRAALNDDRGALAVLTPLEANVAAWVEENPDDDIVDDLAYIRRFITNLEARGALAPSSEQRPPEPWPQD